MGSSKDKFFGIASAIHGFDDIGFSQPSGTISSVARYGAGKWSKYSLVTESAPHNLTRGMSVNITGTTDYDGQARVVAIVSTTSYVINRPFTITKAGTRDGKAGEGNWDAFIPMGADLPAANVALTYWDPAAQGGNDVAVTFTKEQVYVFPGGIKNIVISTAGDVRLIRSASLRPNGLRNPSAPTVAGFNPTGATAGATVDILGNNFSRTPDNNVVMFSNGTKFVPVVSSDSEGKILTVLLPTGVITGPVTVKTHGVNATGPTFNIN